MSDFEKMGATLAAHDRALHQLLDARTAEVGRGKADAFVLTAVIDALAAAGLLDREPFHQKLSAAILAAREVPTDDPVMAALWVAFAERLTSILGKSAPPPVKRS